MIIPAIVFSLAVVSIAILPKATSDIALGVGHIRQYVVAISLSAAIIVALVASILANSVLSCSIVAITVGVTTFVTIVQFRNRQSAESGPQP